MIIIYFSVYYAVLDFYSAGEDCFCCNIFTFFTNSIPEVSIMQVFWY